MWNVFVPEILKGTHRLTYAPFFPSLLNLLATLLLVSVFCFTDLSVLQGEAISTIPSANSVQPSLLLV